FPARRSVSLMTVATPMNLGMLHEQHTGPPIAKGASHRDLTRSPHQSGSLSSGPITPEIGDLPDRSVNRSATARTSVNRRHSPKLLVTRQTTRPVLDVGGTEHLEHAHDRPSAHRGCRRGIC